MMPLEYVTSNAGHPMLLIDRYAYHRHSSNPKSGRINWRCSRRRVKDIRCPSSCFSINEVASIPTAHDPNCQQLSNSDLLTYNTKREQLNNIYQNKNKTSPLSNNNNNDIIMPQLQLIQDYNTEGFCGQNREPDSDEEELNDVLHDLDPDPEPQVNIENEDLDHPSSLEGISEDLMHNNNDLNEEEEDANTDSIKQEESSSDSLLNVETTPPNNTNTTLSAIIDTTTRSMLSNIVAHNRMYEHHKPYHRVLPLETDSSNNGNEKKSIYFVTSKVGHPMLVVDQYTFHKHSTNPKTNRINWRCSRRRVKEIRCPSSCYTIDGVVSNPTPHEVRCCPLSEQMLTSYENKRAKIYLHPGTINTRADSYSTHAPQKNMDDENNNYNEFNDNNPHSFSNECSNDDLNECPVEEQEHEDNEYHRPRLQLLDTTRNKRKENLPTRSNENSEEIYDEFNNCNNNNEILTGNNTENEDLNDEIFYDNNYNEIGQGGGSENPSEVYYDDSVEDEYANNSSDSKVLCQLGDLKRKYRDCTEKLRSANCEVDRIKRTTGLQIQSYVWKSKIMEMDMQSLKSIVQQKNVENSNLKKLVDEMMSNLKSD